MDAQRIKACIDAMAASDLAEMEFSQDGWTLRLVRRPAGSERAAPIVAPPLSSPPGPAGATTLAVAAANEVCAPLHGVVHLQPTPDAASFVSAGQAVKAGQTLCVIEAMKVFNEVRAERDATVDAVLVTSGQEVEAGQPLLRFA